MATLLVREWFRAELQAWQTTHPVPDNLAAVFYDTVNAHPKPAADGVSQWTTLEFPAVNSSAVSIGQPGCKRETGAVNVWVQCKPGVDNDRPVLRIAEGLRTQLRERAAKLADAPPTWLRTLDPQPGQTAQDADGDWFVAIVSVPYECDCYQ